MRPSSYILCATLSALPWTTHAALTAPVQAKVDQYKQKLQTWAADPALVAAIREANARPPADAIKAESWSRLSAQDSPVKEMLDSNASQYLRKLQEDKNISKLLVRDVKGNFVAGSVKPALFNSADKPQFTEALKGTAWSASDVSPDPTTQVPSVQVSAPIVDGDKVIGVINSAVTAE